MSRKRLLGVAVIALACASRLGAPASLTPADTSRDHARAPFRAADDRAGRRPDDTITVALVSALIARSDGAARGSTQNATAVTSGARADVRAKLRAADPQLRRDWSAMLRDLRAWSPSGAESVNRAVRSMETFRRHLSKLRARVARIAAPGSADRKAQRNAETAVQTLARAFAEFSTALKERAPAAAISHLRKTKTLLDLSRRRGRQANRDLHCGRSCATSLF